MPENSSEQLFWLSRSWSPAGWWRIFLWIWQVLHCILLPPSHVKTCTQKRVHSETFLPVYYLCKKKLGILKLSLMTFAYFFFVFKGKSELSTKKWALGIHFILCWEPLRWMEIMPEIKSIFCWILLDFYALHMQFLWVKSASNKLEKETQVWKKSIIKLEEPKNFLKNTTSRLLNSFTPIRKIGQKIWLALG